MDPELIEQFMHIALQEAAAAFEENETPVGSVIVFENRIIGRGHNRTEQLKDASAHAEMIALSAAYNHFGDWRLEGCAMFSTIEPCTMCAGAAMLSRIATIVYGAPDPKFGACGSIFNVPSEPRLNHNAEIIGGVLQDEAAELMQQFFRRLRQGKESVN